MSHFSKFVILLKSQVENHECINLHLARYSTLTCYLKNHVLAIFGIGTQHRFIAKRLARINVSARLVNMYMACVKIALI